MRQWQSRQAEPRAEAAEPRAEAARESQAAAGKAIKPEDFIRARLSVFQRRVERSLDIIRKASEVGAVGVSFSGGKDSTVSLHLVRQVVPSAPAALFDSGSEMTGTHEMAAHVGAQVIHPRLTMLDMARYVGWWGRKDPVDGSSHFDAKRVLIDEPSETFVVKNRLRVIAHGVRGSESHGRSMHVASRGGLYRGRDGTWYCMPIAHWALDDVWAYIASRELRYHTAYDLMAAHGIDRASQRIGGALGDRGSGWGRHQTLRRIDPEVWRALVLEFPHIGLTSG